MEIHIDLLTVVIAAFLNLFIGYVWYSNWLFGPNWMKYKKVKKVDHGMGKMLGAFVISFIIAYFLAFFEAALGITSVTDGMFVGFLLWLGFVATTQIGALLWEKAPFKLFVIDTGYKLLSFLVMSGVIGA